MSLLGYVIHFQGVVTVFIYKSSSTYENIANNRDILDKKIKVPLGLLPVSELARKIVMYIVFVFIKLCN